MSLSRLLTLFFLLLATAPSAMADEGRLGRLFFTPEDRIALDRQGNPEGAKSPSLLTINGIVRRSSGLRTTWLNGRALTEQEAMPPGAEKAKVGETLSMDSSVRTDLLNGGVVSHSKSTALQAGQP